MSENKKLSCLHESYADIQPVSRFNNSPEIENYSTVNLDTDDLNADETQLNLENKQVLVIFFWQISYRKSFIS